MVFNVNMVYGYDMIVLIICVQLNAATEDTECPNAMAIQISRVFWVQMF